MEAASKPRYPTPADEVPVEPVEWPDRLSQTLLRHENRCPRSAYLYVKTMGSVRSHEMDRGTLAHAAAERLMVDLILHGEDSMVAKRADPSIPTEAQEEALSMQTTALVDEVRRELEAAGRVHIPHGEADIARICTFHIALGLDVNPEHVLGIERKFVLDLPSGWEVSVKADLTSTPETGVAQVDDYKTSMYAPSDSEWNPFQVKVGLLALMYGFPVDVVECPRSKWRPCLRTIIAPEGYPPIPAGERIEVRCVVCGGRGKFEMRGERIAGGFQRFRGRELYPRKALWRDGTMHRNERDWTRLELDELLQDLDAAGERINERLQSWKWPARKGSWCNECPDESECPLPARARSFEGAVRDREHAEELWEWALAVGDRASGVQALVKAWAADHGASVRVGDLVWAHKTSETRAVKKVGQRTDWDGLVEAIERAANLGEAFDVDEWVKTSHRTEFKKTKVPTDLIDGEVAQHAGSNGDARDERSADERWGADAPW